MRKYLQYLCALTACALVLAGCGDGSDKGAGFGEKCEKTSDCNDGVNQLICANQVCIAHCAQTGCTDKKVCNDETGICHDPVIDTDKRECSATKPCTAPGKVCSVDYVCVTGSCSNFVPCYGDKLCNSAYQCVECLTSFDCDGKLVCSPDGRCVDCVSDKECGPGRQCNAAYTCESIEGCKAGTCPAGQACAQDGLCFEAECSPIDQCPKDQFCQNKKCVTREQRVCYADKDCGDGYGCDNNKCVPENACSLTRACPDGQICLNGVCAVNEPAACDNAHPCADASLTCVAGQCLECHCADDESCTTDGNCVKRNRSELKKINVGDECTFDIPDPNDAYHYCTWKLADGTKLKTEECTYCEGNLKFSCINSKVSVEDCGGDVCADAVEEGVGCHEPCLASQTNTFYGVCLDSWGEKFSFTQQCSKTRDGKLVWSLQHGYQDCLLDCKQGRCTFVPPEFNQQCTTADYPDACQGDWLTYCYSTSSSPIYGGSKQGTACSTLGDAYFCALPSARALEYEPKIMADCVTSCKQSGERTQLCFKDEDGQQYSDSYICAPTEDGRLADFLIDRETCKGLCDESTGKCI